MPRPPICFRVTSKIRLQKILNTCRNPGTPAGFGVLCCRPKISPPSSLVNVAPSPLQARGHLWACPICWESMATRSGMSDEGSYPGQGNWMGSECVRALTQMLSISVSAGRNPCIRFQLRLPQNLQVSPILKGRLPCVCKHPQGRASVPPLWLLHKAAHTRQPTLLRASEWDREAVRWKLWPLLYLVSEGTSPHCAVSCGWEASHGSSPHSGGGASTRGEEGFAGGPLIG